MIDPIVDEVRKHRAEHARRFNFDLHAICDDIQKMEASCGHTVVSLPRRMLDTVIDQLEPFDQRLKRNIRSWRLYVPCRENSATSLHKLKSLLGSPSPQAFLLRTRRFHSEPPPQRMSYQQTS